MIISYQDCNHILYNQKDIGSSKNRLCFCKFLRFDMGKLCTHQYLRKNKDNFKTIPDVSFST